MASLAGCWVQLPEGHLALASDSELVIGSVSTFVVFRKTAPLEAFGGLAERGRDECERANNVAIGCVPDEEFAIESVTTADQEPIVV